MGLPGFDVVFCLTAPAIDIFIKSAGVAAFQICDDEARVRSIRADLDPRDDPLDTAPTPCPVVERLEAAGLVLPRRRLESFLRTRFESQDVTAQGRRRCDAQGVVDVVGAAPVEHLGSTIM